MNTEMKELKCRYLQINDCGSSTSSRRESIQSADVVTNSESTASTENNVHITKSPDEVLRKRLKVIPERSNKTNDELRDVIRKWQMSNYTKCIHENAVNAVLDSISASNREYSISSLSPNFLFENEAVLMAIEWKGLKQNNSECDGNSDTENSKTSHHSSFDSDIDSKTKDDTSQISSFHDVKPNTCSSSQQGCTAIEDPSTNNETQETNSNFESNFMTKAVSAAIEVKGLSLSTYHV